MTHITEIIPELDTMPDWFRDAFEEGQVFAVALTRVEEARKEAERLWSLLDDISTAGDMFKPPIDAHFKYINKKRPIGNHLLPPT